MFTNLFRTRKNKKKVPVPTSFRPMLESLEDRVVLDAASAAYQALAAQAAPYAQALMHATPDQLTKIAQDWMTAGTAAATIMSAGSSSSSTNTNAVNQAISTYMNAITDLYTQISSLVQASSGSTSLSSALLTGGTSYGAVIPSSSQIAQPSQSNTNPLIPNGGSLLGSTTVVAPTQSWGYIA